MALTLRSAAAIAAWLTAVAVFCWVVAHWVWRALEPVQPPTPQKETANWSSAILSGPALGYIRAEPPATSSQLAANTAGSKGQVRLMGIAREPGDRSQHAARALFRVDEKRVLWIGVGGEIEPGLTLKAIDADAVRLVKDGRESRLLLREPRAQVPRGGAPPGVAPAPPAAQAAAAGGCKLTPEQRNRAYILRPEIIEGVMRERAGWTDLFKPAGIGLMVQNPGGTGAMLGLYGNDILTKADGAQLGGIDDVQRLVLQPLARNESVVVSGVRSGQPREWIYAGINCLGR